jgi:hypothetical protein
METDGPYSMAQIGWSVRMRPPSPFHRHLHCCSQPTGPLQHGFDATQTTSEQPWLDITDIVLTAVRQYVLDVHM